MEESAPRQTPPASEDWQARQRYWQKKLGRIRLGVEPVGSQLAKYRRVTWLLTAIPLAIALFLVALFSAFRRPDVGVIFAGVLFIPVVGLAWLDFALLSYRVSRYESELHERKPWNPPEVL